MIAACARAGEPARGFRFFEVMQAMGVQVCALNVKHPLPLPSSLSFATLPPCPTPSPTPTPPH